VQRLPYKDSERVKSVEGVELLRTQIVLEIEQALATTLAPQWAELVRMQKIPQSSACNW